MNILVTGAVLCSNGILIVTRFERNNNTVYYYKKERIDKFGHLYDGLRVAILAVYGKRLVHFRMCIKITSQFTYDFYTINFGRVLRFEFILL